MHELNDHEAVARDDEYRGLLAQHRDFEARLGELDRKHFLSVQEAVERTNLKKYKLRIKDRIAEIARDPRAGGRR